MIDLRFPDAQRVTVVEADVRTPDGRRCWFPADAILTLAEVAEVLGVDERTVQRYGIRHSTRPTRYLFRDVVAFIEARAA